MAQKQNDTSDVQSGTTTNAQHERHEQHIFIEQIYDEYFDEEMEKYVFDFNTYGGDMISLHLKKRDIERFMLFMRKTDAEQKWMKHIINN